MDETDFAEGMLIGDLPEGAVAIVVGIRGEEGKDMGSDEEDGAGGVGGGVEEIFLRVDAADDEFDGGLIGAAEEHAALGVVEAEARAVGFGWDVCNEADGFGEFHELVEFSDYFGVSGQRLELVLGIGEKDLPLTAFEFLEGNGSIIHTDFEAIPLVCEEAEEAFFAEVGLSGAEELDAVGGNGKGGGPCFAGGVEDAGVVIGGGEEEGLSGGGAFDGKA